MAEHLASLVAEELGLEVYETSKPTASQYGITEVELKSGVDEYRVYVVKDNEDDSEVSGVEENAKLAAFYSSQFILRALQKSKTGFPVGEHKTNFNIQDDDKIYTVFVLKILPTSSASSRILSLRQLIQVAEQMAKLHSITVNNVTKELQVAISEHHGYVAEYDNSLVKDLVDILITTKDIQQYFKRPEDIKSKLLYLVDKCAANKASPGKFDEVITHGRLSSEFCKFEENKLVEVTNWEKVHFSDPAKDLSYLIALSATPEVRRKHYMEIFRHYYFQLVDLRAPKFNLSELREMYKFHQKHAVLTGLESLLDVLLNSAPEEDKTSAAEIWECALQDAHEYETNDNDSDDEQCLFK